MKNLKIKKIKPINNNYCPITSKGSCFGEGFSIPCKKTLTILGLGAIISLLPFISIFFQKNKPYADINKSIQIPTNFGNLKILSVKTNKIKNLYIKNDTIEFTITTTGTNGGIKIFSVNKLLKFPYSFIQAEPNKNTYKITAKAIKPGRDYIAFTDGTNIKTLEIGIFPESNYPMGLMIKGPNTIKLNQKTNFEIFFVNILGYKEEKYIKNGFKILLLSGNKILDSQEIKINENYTYNYPINFWGYTTGNFKLAILYQDKEKTYYSVKNIKIIE